MSHEKKIVFAIGCHPDDIEFTIAGTLLLLKDRGHEIHYMTIANGSWGSATMRREETILTRRDEARAAAELLGAHYHESLVDDLDVYYDRKTLMRLCATIREVDPDIVLCQSPSDYMEDHQNAVRLVYTAAFCKCMPNAPVDPPTPATFKDVAVYHAAPHGSRDILRKVVRSERYVDITSVIDRKAAMLACHVSQGAWLDASQGYCAYIESMRENSALVGKLSEHYQYAEGWRRHSHLGFSQTDIDPLGELLGDVSWVDPNYEKWLNA
ncbi:MAG: PIG-L family deacetylase [Thermoguttaceae bacterium]|nr:PIG-L family deacetylase [Thermoguttaceae bacterium]MDO5748076.1 PIG-L family deacetylase [Planctomycetia bacterium]